AEGAGGITAVTHEGAVILPNSAGSTEAQSRARLGRQYTLAFTDVKEVPVRVRLEVLVRSGAPTRVAFRLPDLPLPQGLDLSAELEEPAGGTGPLRPGDSLYTANGATLVVPVRHDGAAANGTVLVGLSRVDGAGAGSWRWIEVAADAEGRAVLGSLRPGRYRVARQWLGEPRQSEEPGRLPEHPVRAQAVLEAELLPGKTAILPVLQLGATP
ncbi:MAG TPA: hypothetical protein VK689_05330, partial [Armatimonadota bacterium]|nr:hypothetical protein [Armatimonadota bacterium]